MLLNLHKQQGRSSHLQHLMRQDIQYYLKMLLVDFKIEQPTSIQFRSICANYCVPLYITYLNVDHYFTLCISTHFQTFKATLMTRNNSVTVQVLNRAETSLKTNLGCHLCMKISYLRLVLKYMSNQSSTYFSSDSKIKTCFTQNNII